MLMAGGRQPGGACDHHAEETQNVVSRQRRAQGAARVLVESVTRPCGPIAVCQTLYTY